MVKIPVAEIGTIELTIPRLDKAIASVLGMSLYVALSRANVDRARMHDMACMRAFVLDNRSADATILREMLIYLGRNGHYPDGD